MANEELKKYIYDNLANGVSEELIKNKLLEVGHDNYAILPIISEVRETMVKERKKKKRVKKQVISTGTIVVAVLIIVAFSFFTSRSIIKSMDLPSSGQAASASNLELFNQDCIRAKSYKNDLYGIVGIMDGEVPVVDESLISEDELAIIKGEDPPTEEEPEDDPPPEEIIEDPLANIGEMTEEERLLAEGIITQDEFNIIQGENQKGASSTTKEDNLLQGVVPPEEETLCMIAVRDSDDYFFFDRAGNLYSYEGKFTSVFSRQRFVRLPILGEEPEEPLLSPEEEELLPRPDDI